MKTCFLFFVVFVSIFTVSCSKPVPNHAIDVFLEAPTRSNSFGLHQEIVLPVSGIRAKITTPPVADIDSFTNAEFIVQEIPQTGEEFLGIRLHVKEDKWLRIFQASGEAISEGRGLKRFFLVVDGQPIGYCLIRGRQIRRNDLFFIIEEKREGVELVKALKNVCFNLNEYILAWREYTEKR